MLPKFAPFSCTDWNRFEYDVTERPLIRVGSKAVPPGNCNVKSAFGATEPGAITSMVTSRVWLSVVVPTTNVHCTPGNVRTMCCDEVVSGIDVVVEVDVVSG